MVIIMITMKKGNDDHDNNNYESGRIS
jgi:hypothetical protein